MKARPLYISLILFGVYSVVLLTFACLQYGILKTIAGWAVGFLAFTFIEYLFHRFFFHMETGTPRKANLQYSIHGNHHTDPDEVTAIMMRPVVALMVLPVITLLFYGLFRWYTLMLLPGFLFGYAAYLFIHFAIHNFKPPKSFLRYLWKHHKLHHFYDDSRNYGVSSPLWDILLNTYISGKTSSKKKATPK